MGKKIVVSSTIYSLTGDEENRPDYLVSNLFSAVMSNHDNYLGETIVGNYLSGPGIKQRNFFNWAKRNNYAGMPAFSVRNVSNVDPYVVAGEIPVPASPAGLETYIQRAFIGDADFEAFAEKHILDNYPERMNTDWAADYDKNTHQITIQFESDPTVSFGAGIFNTDSQFLIAEYYQAVPSSEQTLVTGPETTDETDPLNLPDDTGYTLVSTTNTTLVSHTRNKNTLIVDSYSDARPDETVSDTDEDISSNFQNFETLKTKSVYNGGDGDTPQTSTTEYSLYVEEKRYIVETVTETTETFDEGGGVTRTRTTTVTEDTLEPIWDFREDTQETIHTEIVGGSQMYIYEIGSGNATLDALADTPAAASTQEFFPFIPVRLDNVGIGEEPYLSNGLYDEARRAYRRATDNQSFDKMVEDIEDNDDLDEIDYAYMCYGVPLNVIDNSSRKYLYEFFAGLQDYQSTTAADVTTFENNITTYNSAHSTWAQWVIDQSNSGSAGYGTAQPTVPALGKPEETTIQVKTSHALTSDYDNRISWVNIEEETFTGLGKPDAKRNEVWLTNDTPIAWTESVGLGRLGGAIRDKLEELSVTYIYYQTSLTEYKRLKIVGLMHRNYIYGGKAVEISGAEALEDPDLSGFLVPLHMPTMKDLGLVDATQMATSNSYLVFNSYKIYKKKWYQSFLFILIIIIAIVVLTVVFPPAGTTAGLLGTNAAVGAAIGLTGAAAVVVGAVVNAIAAILLSKILTAGATAIFGDVIGNIIGTILSIALTGGFEGGLSNLGSAQNILNISSALANGYNGWVQGNIADINQQLIEGQEEYKDAMREIKELMRGLGGTNSLYFDPITLTNTDRGNGQQTGSYTPEGLDEFIHRTTLVGSDIAEITLSMVTDYADLNLQLPKHQMN